MLSVTTPSPIAGLAVISSMPVQDSRGKFARLFCTNLLADIHAERPIAQVNFSLTCARGSVRGLHYQRSPAAEGKWVRCLRGRVLDIAVDLRAGSPTFLNHFAVELSAEAMNAIFIPEGCAHGFQTLETDCELLYLHTAPYTPAHEGGVRWDDPRLDIVWPLPVSELSDRDRSHPLLTADFEGLTL